MLPRNIKNLIEEFSKLPGIGPKTAQRLTFSLLKRRKQDVVSLKDAVGNIQENVSFCSECYSLMTASPTTDVCKICSDPGRDKNTVCVVEEILDAVAIEKSGIFNGVYHILHGALSPIDRIGPGDIKLMELVKRVEAGGIKEIILATNPNMSGEATNMFIINALSDLDIHISTIARGIPMGGELEYADQITLKRALEGRIKA